MEFTNDLIKKTLSDAKTVFNGRKLTLLKCSNKILTSFSYVNCNEKLLTDLKDVLDKINSCISYCDNFLLKLDTESDFIENFEVSTSALFEDVTFIDKFLNDLIFETDIIFKNNPNAIESCADVEDTSVADISKDTYSTTEVTDKNDVLTDNNILLISEKEKKVFLPYKICDLKEQLEKDKTFKNLNSIIEQRYVLPIEQFNNPIVSRFKQAYILSKNKSNKSMVSSVELALELAFNYSLNPAIIVACRNIDELDIYLDCLEENELDKFDLFEIKYEILPR